MQFVKEIGTVLALTVSMAVSANAERFDLDAGPEPTSKTVAVDATYVNGEYIYLPRTVTSEGLVCESYLETAQFIAYGETAYTLGKRCSRPTPELEEA